MYFRKYGRRKTWLNKCLKSPVSEDPSTGNLVNELNHFFHLNTAFFSYLLITVNAIELENVHLSS